MKHVSRNNFFTRSLFYLYLEQIRKVDKFDFFIIGAQKCGTTALSDYLNESPYCMGPKCKETLLFTKNYKDNIDGKTISYYFMRKEWFKKYTKQLLFEATPDNIYYEEVPERIYRHNPKARLILLVREPVSRAISEYNMAFWFAKERELCVREDQYKDYFDYLKCPEKYSFSWFIEEELRQIKETGSLLPSAFHFPDFIRHGLYSEQLKRYYKYFNSEQILVLEDIELKKQRKETLYKIENFLGIPHKIWTDDEIKISNVGVYNLPVQEDCKRFLTDFFRSWNEEFFQMIGRRMNW